MIKRKMGTDPDSHKVAIEVLKKMKRSIETDRDIKPLDKERLIKDITYSIKNHARWDRIKESKKNN